MLDRHDAASGVPMLALMLANNETGVLHPVAEAAGLVKAHGGFVFCDAVQAIGRLPVDIAALGVDFLAISSHKIGGPQGAGALVLANGEIRPQPLLTGGGQERGHRAGTENVAAIAGFGVAAEQVMNHLEDVDSVAGMRDRLEADMRRISPDVQFAGADVARLPNTTMCVVPGIAAETAVIAFDLEGIAVSSGAACSSGKISPSHVLQAMGFPAELSSSGIRVSLPADVTSAEIDQFLAAWRSIDRRLRPHKAA
jgi:cysteine desulfurase